MPFYRISAWAIRDAGHHSRNGQLTVFELEIQVDLALKPRSTIYK